MRIAWIGQPQQEDAKRTVEAWAENAPGGLELHRGLDPSCDLLVFLEPADMKATEAQLAMRRRFGQKTVLVIHDYLAFSDPWLAKRVVQLCNSVRLLVFWSRAHEQAFRILHPGIRTEGRWAPIVAKSDYKRRRRKRKTQTAETEEDARPTYESALVESSRRFWQIAGGIKC